MRASSRRCSGFGGDPPKPYGDGPHLPVSRLDPGRSPPGHRPLPHCGDPHQQEEEVGADVMLQRAKEGEELPVNHMKRLIISEEQAETQLLDLLLQAALKLS